MPWPVFITHTRYFLQPPLLSPPLAVTGSCEAVVDHNPVGSDELQLSQGDLIEIQGMLLRGLDLFIGTHCSTGNTGFVHKAHVKPLNAKPP
jgi:hypothetical protein